jgi:hypothetical protein
MALGLKRIPTDPSIASEIDRRGADLPLERRFSSLRCWG